MFSQEQKDALRAKLDGSCVKQRAQAGRSFSYIEGWHAIAEANRIFGFDSWDRQTVELRQLFDPVEKESKWRVAYMAKVRIIVKSGTEDHPDATVREGTGYGSGIARDLGDAHESAIKEAETDAMKRALMTFGNPFGLALYDKEQTNVEAVGDKAPPKPDNARLDAEAWVAGATFDLQQITTFPELHEWWNKNFTTIKALPADLKAKITAVKDAKKTQLQKDAA